MYLSKVVIDNFRGLRHLELDFNFDNTVLIGENTWGKSSLFRVLWVLLGKGEQLYQFQKEDLYIPVVLNFQENIEDSANNEILINDSLFLSHSEDNYLKYSQKDKDFFENDIYKESSNKIEISLFFKEHTYGLVNKSSRLQRLSKAWVLGDDGLYFIHWNIKAFYKDENFITEHYLLNNANKEIDCDKESIIKLLISMNPLIRVRDGRYFVSENEDDTNLSKSLNNCKSYICEDNERHLKSLAEDILKLQSDDSNAAEIMQSLELINSLSQKYLGNYEQRGFRQRNRKNVNSIKDMVTKPVSIESLSNIKEQLNSKTFNLDKILSYCLISSLVMAKGDRVIDKQAKPILVLEDVESRFHPSLLLSFWSIISNMPLQKIMSTNSGDFLTATKISDIRRLSRKYYDTRCYRVIENNFSADELRRIAFHVRMNRPMSFFARVWLLVEGETEVWMLNQMAQLLGIRLLCIGVRSIEFAQCGLHPLMHLASELGISFYVLTDGDEAGKKYASSVISYVGRKNLHKHLTLLPQKDIEHFFYHNGFADIYNKEANIQFKKQKQISVDKIIEIAIKRKSKPGLALAVCEAMYERGGKSVPKLFRILFKNLENLSRNNMFTD